MDYPDGVGLYHFCFARKRALPRWVVEHVLIHPVGRDLFRFAKKQWAGVDYPDGVGLYYFGFARKRALPRWVVEHLLIHT